MAWNHTIDMNMRLSPMFLLILLLACTSKTETSDEVPDLDLDKELESIEKTRTLFTEAVKSGDGSLIGSLVTSNVISVGPGSEEWNKMYMDAKEGQIFPYDSIVMAPMETVIVSDTVAYDFGKSRVYYTTSEGEVLYLEDTFLAIMKKGKDGKWRLHREVASSRVN